ncbi:MAG: tRNA pseudouridine(55) synthase TruB [Planctomycetota bacterium]|nr:tRNA pseudouridine(55) synthase TruB [Planctomycetota bacterium]
MGRRPRYRKSALSGLLVVDKPLGWTSMDVVRKVRTAAGWVKTGHGGTLDPLATGVVVCCIGSATRAVEAIMKMGKVYETTIDLSAFTRTDDAEAEREEVEVATPPDEAAVRAALEAFIGDIEQVPPKYSAVHVEGKRAYKLAREGTDVVLEARPVRIDAIEVLGYEYPRLKILVRCGKGVYVRSLARDLGKALGTGGHLAALRRTAIGEYGLEGAATAERLMSPIGQFDLLDPPPVEPC